MTDEIEPKCDICGESDGEGEADWNGETGNHKSCEMWTSDICDDCGRTGGNHDASVEH